MAHTQHLNRHNPTPYPSSPSSVPPSLPHPNTSTLLLPLPVPLPTSPPIPTSSSTSLAGVDEEVGVVGVLSLEVVDRVEGHVEDVYPEAEAVGAAACQGILAISLEDQGVPKTRTLHKLR